MTLNPETFLQGTPVDIRRRLVACLLERYAGDMAFYGTLAQDEQGWVMAGAVPVGPPAFQALWKATDGIRLMDQGVDLEHYWNFNEFSRGDRTTEPSAVVDGWWKPFEIMDVLGINVCRDLRYLGYIGVYRTLASPRFTQADLKRASDDARFVRHVLEAADALASKVTVPVGAHVIDAGGKLMFTASDPTGAQVCVRSLEQAAQDFLAYKHAGDVLVGQSLVSMSLLNGASGPAVLAIVRPTRDADVPPILHLTRLKRSIATYAAHGATTAEIATTLGRKPETIRAHLKEIYARLGVSSRVELAELVERARTNPPK